MTQSKKRTKDRDKQKEKYLHIAEGPSPLPAKRVYAGWLGRGLWLCWLAGLCVALALPFGHRRRVHLRYGGGAGGGGTGGGARPLAPGFGKNGWLCGFSRFVHITICSFTSPTHACNWAAMSSFNSARSGVSISERNRKTFYKLSTASLKIPCRGCYRRKYRRRVEHYCAETRGTIPNLPALFVYFRIWRRLVATDNLELHRRPNSSRLNKTPC
jgi:hypothetical protein